uniref:Reverse transcriptase Ty1/copia-type domain-containing protein n=1 Tax=Trichuris muris TaxID=70415 RepID=A0A5S6R440_TRIMR
MELLRSTRRDCPVVRFDTMRTILSVGAVEKLEFRQFDVKTAFLYGTLEEEVYVKQPEGFENGTNSVCRLNRSLYGLKQSPRCWNKKLVDFLKKKGMNKALLIRVCSFEKDRSLN